MAHAREVHLLANTMMINNYMNWGFQRRYDKYNLVSNGCDLLNKLGE